MRVQQFIGGVWRPGGSSRVMDDLDPFSGHVIEQYRAASIDDVDEAYAAAADVQRRWRRLAPADKRAVFERVINIVIRREEEIIDLAAEELGGTRDRTKIEIALVIDMLKEAATLPFRAGGTTPPSVRPGARNIVSREPVGVVSVISPFNFPFFLGIKSVAPALALGNGVVLKPHPETPQVGGVLIGEIFEEAGLPPGLLNVVCTDVDEIGNAFVEHPTPAVISFTGSAAVGRRIASLAGDTFKDVVLELGGNSAFIVLDDARLGRAVDDAITSRFTHQGQVCMSANRILVERSIYDEFVDRFTAKAAALPVGDPREPGVVIGPLINENQARELASLVAQGISEGARPVLPGKVEGTLFHPTVLADVTARMTVARVELFGPVVCIMPFGTDAEAVEIANSSTYGLSGAIHTTNLDRGFRLADQIDTGMIHINDTTIHDEATVPFGGVKHSGIGRLNGDAAITAFTTEKWISVQR
jgi:vanillin dehydrogenase